MRKEEQGRELRRSIYWTFIAITMCIAAGRICNVVSKEGDTAFLSANDRSRWCTVASLVDDGTYEIDRLVNLQNEKRRRPWNTIDKVRHRGADAELHYYSSKPPLYPTMVAGVYAVIKTLTRMEITEQPIYVPRAILLIVNLPLLLLFCWSTIWAIDLICADEWARRIVAACTCFATMVFPFSITLNNHLPAAAATAFVMYMYILAAEKMDDRITGEQHRSHWLIWFATGAAAAFAAANELPALSMLGLWFILVLWLDWKSAQFFVSGVAIVAAAFFVTNSIAHESLRPPYAHRDNGEVIAELESGAKPSIDAIAKVLIDAKLVYPDVDLKEEPSGEEGRTRLYTYDKLLFALNRTGDEGPNAKWTLSHWDDWYDYPGSYWSDGKRRGVDLGEPSRLTYFANMTIGHYGIFSITPIWILVPFGIYIGFSYGPREYTRLVIAIAIASIVCIAFYLMRPQIDRNYGGVSSCFRWVLWFAPLWLLVIAPAIQVCGDNIARRIAVIAFMCASIFSAAISLSSPWQSPWIYRFWSFLGWIGN